MTLKLAWMLLLAVRTYSLTGVSFDNAAQSIEEFRQWRVGLEVVTCLAAGHAIVHGVSTIRIESVYPVVKICAFEPFFEKLLLGNLPTVPAVQCCYYHERFDSEFKSEIFGYCGTPVRAKDCVKGCYSRWLASLVADSRSGAVTSATFTYIPSQMGAGAYRSLPAVANTPPLKSATLGAANIQLGNEQPSEAFPGEVNAPRGRYALIPAGGHKEISRTYFTVSISDLSSGKNSHTHIRVTGKVVLVKHEADGDLHIKLSDGKHWIVAECIPKLPCAEPKVGQTITVEGIYRRDVKHGNWAECHPVESLTVLKGGTP